MRLSSLLVAVLGLAVLACGPAGTTTKQETSPLPPLKRVAGKDPQKTGHGGTVLDPAGKEVELGEAYASANALIVFYRGAW